jgi:integrase
MPLADGSKRQVVEIASAVYRAAIDDGIIGRDPTKAASVDRPSAGRTKARPWPRERIAAMRDALPPRFAVIPELGAGSGMRQGEMFGLADTDVQFLARKPVISVTRQVKIVGGRPHFGPLKNRKPHSVPLSPVLRDLLARHMELYPPAAVTLPWHDPGDKAMHGTLVTVRLVLTRPGGGALHRRDFDEQVWRKALLRAGIIAGKRGPARQDGCHVLRHTYASVQLRAGVDVVRVAAWLGDTAAMVVGTYGHLLPGDDDSDGRAAVDAFLGSCAPDVPLAGELGTLPLAGA